MAIRSNGFTLIELVIYIALLTILLTILSNIFSSSLDLELESETVSSIIQDGRFILGRISFDIQRADSIVTPANPGNTSTTLQLTISGVNYIYSLNNGNLQINIGAVTDNLNSYDTTISNLAFKRLGNSGGKNSIQVEFNATSVSQRSKGTETKSFETAIQTR